MLVVPFDVLKQTEKGFKKILHLTEEISKHHTELLQKYITSLQLENNERGILQYFFNPIFRQFYRDSRYRLLVVKIEKDLVLTFIKEIRMNKAQYIRAMGYPYSISGFKKYEDDLARVLVDLGLVNQFILYPSEITRFEELEIVPKPDIKFYDTYFFTFVSKNIERMTNKFKTKNKINAIEKHKELWEVELVDINKDSSLTELDHLWNSKKKQGRTHIYESNLLKKLVKNYRPTRDSTDIVVIKCTFKGKPLWFNVFVKSATFWMYDELVFKSAARINEPEKFFEAETETEKRILKFMLNRSAQQNCYYTMQFLNIINAKLIGQAGYLKDEGIRQYKMQTSTDYIDLFQTDTFKLSEKRSKTKKLSTFI